MADMTLDDLLNVLAQQTRPVSGSELATAAGTIKSQVERLLRPAVADERVLRAKGGEMDKTWPPRVFGPAFRHRPATNVWCYVAASNVAAFNLLAAAHREQRDDLTARLAAAVERIDTGLGRRTGARGQISQMGDAIVTVPLDVLEEVLGLAGL